MAYVQQEGFTHVEFMPLAEHPFSGSWGYQVTGYYAVDSRLGGPRRLPVTWSSSCIEAGIGVIMDWVPAHFPKDAFALGRFDGTPSVRGPGPDRAASTRIGAPTCSTSDAAKCATSWWPTPCFWLEELPRRRAARGRGHARCCTWTTAAKPGQWRPNIYGGRENLEAIDFLKEATAPPRTRTIRAS